ncbi:hypothetical protein T4E_6048 [Trichinella pseudospiralis]|uniref:MULE transposase domain-containing protein n=1 Tax=Trichinella pseudospiralis TaxID=6337 RepID=A0A0V0Y141_TRIPS|nr:hypothetical protein T4E_6048 [Trichinella pseudospiralis]
MIDLLHALEDVCSLEECVVEFLLWQSASRYILVFATGSNIRLLAVMRTVDMDSTFKLVPAVYCLCPGKDIGTYWRDYFSSFNKQSGSSQGQPQLNPQTIICDFETALIPAIHGYFPNTKAFHVFQAVHRKVRALAPKTRYKTEAETRKNIRMLRATAFLSVTQVDTGDSLFQAGTTELITENKMTNQKKIFIKF